MTAVDWVFAGFYMALLFAGMIACIAFIGWLLIEAYWEAVAFRRARKEYWGDEDRNSD